MRRFRPTDPATAALGGHQTSTVLCDPPPADRPGAIGGAAAPPLFGAPLAAPPIRGPDQFMRKPGAGPRVWPPWTPGSTHGAHTDPPAAFLRATARPAADVRPALVTPRQISVRLRLESMVWAPVWARGRGTRIRGELLGYSAERASSFLASRKVSVALYCVGWISVL